MFPHEGEALPQVTVIAFVGFLSQAISTPLEMDVLIQSIWHRREHINGEILEVRKLQKVKD